ncbi:hypothetical protein DM01DRAFT_1331112 [Hesseltinella vesiculosa]|uniref:Uncharacterized protein n=1 Tax=Hesseltinella vesiculosa TaxID=101127 RepID=A0A1X2GY51_9FUNG|nr:hypothetical protein DM01DRAFT_1331112 [Hesseltinella vesiculosa]
MELEKRDMTIPIHGVLDKLEHCNGTRQDLIHRLRTNRKPIRLIVLDYAGLSTDFGDIQKYEQIVEVVVDLDFGFDLISRQDILNVMNLPCVPSHKTYHHFIFFSHMHTQLLFTYGP